MPKKIVFSSTNAAKRYAATQILTVFFDDYDLICVEVDSGVSATPFSSVECMQGCINRVYQIKKLQPDADFWVGAEGGLEKFGEKYFLGGWVLVENSHGVQNWAASSWVQIPDDVIQNMSPDKRLNEALDYSKYENILVQNRLMLGTNGILTKGVYTRIDEFSDALKIAFSQF
jgi:non-canonical (house-cleaning) NTP pyrophosphatase